MTTLAVRGVWSGLAATVKLIVVGPVPLGGIPVTHEGAPLPDHSQPPEVLTETELAPPDAGALWPPGASEYAHPPDWLTVKLWPPMMMTTVRAGPGFDSTVNTIVCVPIPLGGTPVTHAGTSLVFHVQPDAVEIVTEPCPPAVANDWPAGAME